MSHAQFLFYSLPVWGNERLWGVTSEGRWEWGPGAKPLVRGSEGEARQKWGSEGCAPSGVQEQSPWPESLGTKTPEA